MDVNTSARVFFLETVTTPLKGRKVWLDPGPFDLAHSLMQATDKYSFPNPAVKTTFGKEFGKV